MFNCLNLSLKLDFCTSFHAFFFFLAQSRLRCPPLTAGCCRPLTHSTQNSCASGLHEISTLQCPAAGGDAAIKGKEMETRHWEQRKNTHSALKFRIAVCDFRKYSWGTVTFYLRHAGRLCRFRVAVCSSRIWGNTLEGFYLFIWLLSQYKCI